MVRTADRTVYGGRIVILTNDLDRRYLSVVSWSL